jgi:hypothetical protein
MPTFARREASRAVGGELLRLVERLIRRHLHVRLDARAFPVCLGHHVDRARTRHLEHDVSVEWNRVRRMRATTRDLAFKRATRTAVLYMISNACPDEHEHANPEHQFISSTTGEARLIHVHCRHILVAVDIHGDVISRQS